MNIPIAVAAEYTSPPIKSPIKPNIIPRIIPYIIPFLKSSYRFSFPGFTYPYISPIINASISNIIFSPLEILKGQGVYKFFYLSANPKQVIFSLDIPYPFCLIRYIAANIPNS
ncbi:hypothetical protein C5S29_00070 [ANME-1 cluster archaeon GoMg3.2]|nr:hypothetical protein [ANME-1 cluster archaeon GoMg3.2]